jgi:hypothetical protein
MILGAPLLCYNYLCQKLKSENLKKSICYDGDINCGTHYLQICVIQIHYQHSFNIQTLLSSNIMLLILYIIVL